MKIKFILIFLFYLGSVQIQQSFNYDAGPDTVLFQLFTR